MTECPLAVHWYLGLGNLYRQTSKQGQVREHFTTATEMYREMVMQFTLEKADVEMREPA